ncbi:unnamed protein product [Cylindrotheca closterium]|uniref:Uncharacterized protein n=1 Tax=Cylindrotheca closterium TaxID=2856 RepID=A0AAD2FH49_9STRA|nr:unnamed protein product [Cylindrotheca closterium]
MRTQTQTQTTITRAQTTITLAEEEQEVKKQAQAKAGQAQAKAGRAKRKTRDEAHHVLVRAANIQMIRNMPEADAALTKRPERKGGIVVEDDMRAPFTLQDYVKVMGIAVTAFAFKYSIENGGDGLKIGFYRAQTNKVAKKLVRQGVRQDDGSIKRTGAVIREKGDLYLVDCNVTGSSEGTPDDPKFALKKLFEHHIFQKLDGLVAAGGQYEGYIPVIQGDNAGPHAEKEYFNWCKAQCEQRGWHWEPQAPQMPHINNLDLSVFPCMSRRHCAAARERGGLHVLK